METTTFGRLEALVARSAHTLALSLVLAFGLSAPALSQAEPAAHAQDAEETETIIVHGARRGPVVPYIEVQHFVVEIGDLPGRKSGYARWDKGVCVAAANLQADRAQYVVDRISGVALDLGLTPGEPGCTPNVSIVFTNDGRAFASDLVRRRRSLFRPFGGVGGTTQGLAALRRFASSDAPVRWWQITMPVDRAGNPAVDVGVLGVNAPPQINSPGTHLTSATRDELLATYIVVDVTKTGDVTWPQLADYLAMVGLGQIDPEADIGARDSVLALFASEQPAAGLTAWDESYLHALYSIDMTGARNVQRGALVEKMAYDRRLSGARD